MVADWVLVTDKPKKLKKAIEMTFSKTAIMIIGLFPICFEFHKKYIEKFIYFQFLSLIAMKMGQFRPQKEQITKNVILS